MNYYPIKNTIQRRTRQQIQMLGINLSDNYTDGQLEDCNNICADRFPYITTQKNLVEQNLSGGYGVLSMFAWEEMFVVTDHYVNGQGYACFYGGEPCGYMPTNDLPKQYAVVNTQMVVYPDKVYFNLNDANIEPHSLDTATLIGTGTVTFELATDDTPARMAFTDNTITSRVNANHKILIIGAKELTLNATYTIDSITNSDGKYYINITSDFLVDRNTSDNVSFYDAGADGEYEIAPDMDYICASDNRIWGVNNEQRTIYASALGDATDFHSYEGLDTDAYAVAVGSAGAFTGCVALQNTVLFLKQHTIHKLLGGYPSEYVMYEYKLDGASETNGRSIVNCDGTAVFVTEHGIGTYYGSSSGTLSKELGEGGIYNAVGEYDGEKYILSFEDDNNVPHLYIFDMRYNIWTKVENIYATDIQHLGNDNYILTDGTIYKFSGELDDDWDMTLRPIIETLTGTYNSKTSIFNKKRYWKIYIRLELPIGSTFEAEVKTDNGAWHNAGRIAGDKDGVRTLVFKTDRCDKFQMRFKGHGPMTILAIEREFTEGSTR